MTTATYEDLLNNPDKLASMSMEEIEAFTASLEDSQTGELKDGEKVESPATPAEVDKPDVVDDPKGVQDKSGNSIIPYEVLVSERNKSKELAQSKAEADARIAELEAQIAKTASASNTAELDETLFLSDEELEVLAEELPAEAERTRKIQDLAKRQAYALQQKEVDAERLQKSLAVNTTQIAIDSVPKLAFIQATKPALFSLAVSIDNQLQQEALTNPAIAAMSLTERFNLAVTRLEEEIGTEIDVKKSSTPTSEQLKLAATQAKTAADTKASTTPLSMADIQGGAIPPADEYANFFDKSPQEMEVAMSKMTDSQKNALYARIR